MAEALRFQGVVGLETRFEFGKWDELWSTVGRKYMPYVEFGKTGMGCDRFKDIFSAQRYKKNAILPFKFNLGTVSIDNC